MLAQDSNATDNCSSSEAKKMINLKQVAKEQKIALERKQEELIQKVDHLINVMYEHVFTEEKRNYYTQDMKKVIEERIGQGKEYLDLYINSEEENIYELINTTLFPAVDCILLDRFAEGFDFVGLPDKVVSIDEWQRLVFVSMRMTTYIKHIELLKKLGEESTEKKKYYEGIADLGIWAFKHATVPGCFVRYEELFDLATENGCVKPYYFLGSAYLSEELPVGSVADWKVNPLKAIENYEKAADMNYEDSALIVGKYCFTGIYLVPDFEKARKYLEKWLESNEDHEEALIYLGRIYMQGLCVKRDLVKAKECFQKCGFNGISWLGQVALIEKDYALAKECFEKVRDDFGLASVYLNDPENLNIKKAKSLFTIERNLKSDPDSAFALGTLLIGNVDRRPKYGRDHIFYNLRKIYTDEDMMEMYQTVSPEMFFQYAFLGHYDGAYQIHMNYGMVYLNIGELEKAKDAFETADSKMDPEAIALLFGFIEDNDKLKTILEASVNRGNVLAHGMLAVFYTEREPDETKAKYHHEQMLVKGLNRPEVIRYLTMKCLMNGDADSVCTLCSKDTSFFGPLALSFLYEKGLLGVEVNLEKAALYKEEALSLGCDDIINAALAELSMFESVMAQQ